MPGSCMLASRGPDVLSHEQTTRLGSPDDAAGPPACQCATLPTRPAIWRSIARKPAEPSGEDDGLPVVGAVIDAGARFQAGGRIESGHLVRHCRIPAEFRETAEHSVRWLPTVTSLAHLDTVQARSRRCHRDEAIRLDDSLASEDDLHRIATASNINNGQPDPAAVRMIPDLYDPTDDDPLCPDSLRTLCPHSPRTLSL